ncbi:hypothetical protein [Pontibacter sp. HSC-36F09]|uniref:hypothetical protein n=1 Tax=Pontibacter sp. HSC-36F09 TaxID=2910966 RepID=UPI00209ECE64|nr:hypothetical protein [Pontibacter sp. HSC-36F09]MCP2045914.1 hypothetical protein [Pontibacter sp. HSC-36F09]
MPEEENKEWLTALKSRGKVEQLSMVKKRFFLPQPARDDLSEINFAVPILVIDGIAVTDKLSDSSREQLFHLLTEETVKEIAVLDEQPEELYINRRWTGIIVVVLSDKKVSRKLQKIKIE